MRISFRRQRGVALPVMLIMLGVMLISSIYLLKASNSSTMTTSNLAYEASLGKAVDLGLLTGFKFLSDSTIAGKTALEGDITASGYLSTYVTGQSTADSAFWANSTSFDDGAGNHIEYVIHRMCAFAGPSTAANQLCMQTAPNSKIQTPGQTMVLGDSAASDAAASLGLPQIHYIVTARIFGPRGGNVVNQAVVMIGA